MRVTVERMGGITGEVTVVAQYETAELPEAAAAEVRAAVESLAASGGAGEIGADLPGYRVTVGGPGEAAPRVFEFRGDPSADARGPLRTLLAPVDG